MMSGNNRTKSKILTSPIVTGVKMSDVPAVSVSKIKELLERRQSNRPKFIRQPNAFGKVASIVQEFNSSNASQHNNE